MDFDPSTISALTSIGKDLGISVLGNAVYDAIKFGISKLGGSTQEELAAAIHDAQPSITIRDAKIYAERAVTFLASRGFIDVAGTHVHARGSLTTGSTGTGATTVRDGSRLETTNTRIDIGQGAAINTTGKAKIVQNEDGSISFYT